MVLGSEERFTDLTNINTFYIISFKKGDNELRYFKRFSLIVEIFEVIKSRFPDLIKFERPHRTWFDSKKLKTIEIRKIFIE